MANLVMDGVTIASKSGSSVSLQNVSEIENPQNDYIGFRSIQKFTTSGTSTWTKPVGVNLIKVYVTGGGGGGGSHNTEEQLQLNGLMLEQYHQWRSLLVLEERLRQEIHQQAAALVELLLLALIVLRLEVLVFQLGR